MSVAGKGSEEERGGIRARILSEAARLFAQKGFADTSIRDITAAARVTAPMIYYYFGNKESLFRALLREPLELLHDRSKAIADGDLSFPQKLVELLTMHYEAIQQMPETARLFVMTQFGPDRERFLGDSQQVFMEFRARFLRLIEEGQRCGELAPGSPELLDLHFAGLINTPMLAFLDGFPVPLGRELAEALVDQFLNGARRAVVGPSWLGRRCAGKESDAGGEATRAAPPAPSGVSAPTEPLTDEAQKGG